MQSKGKVFYTVGILAWILFLCLFIVDCSTFTRNTYGSIKTSAVMVDSAMKVCAELYAEGYISDEELEDIKALHRSYRSTYMIAVDSLAAYKQTGDKADREMLDYAIVEMTVLGGEIAVLADNHILKKSKKGGK